MTVMNEAAVVLADLVTLRKAKKNLGKKEYKRQRDQLMDRAEEVVRQNREESAAAAPESSGGATITHRPDVAYVERSAGEPGNAVINLNAAERNHLIGLLSAAQAGTDPIGDGILHKLEA